MAEDGLVKHTRKVIKVMREKSSVKHKITELLIEIATIVFAISLSLLVERWREHSTEKLLEHNFLSSLAGDLKRDLSQLKQDSASYVHMKNGFGYLRRAYTGKQLKRDSAVEMTVYLYNTIGFVPSSSRYEALKASGKLDVIENKDLQVNIVNLYQQTIPMLTASTDWFTSYKNKLSEYADMNLVIKSDQNNIQQFAQRPATYNLLNKDPYIDNIINNYHIALQQTRNIIKEIKTEADSR